LENRTSLVSLDRDELLKIMKDHAQPAYRANQAVLWLAKGAQIDEMENLPLALRDALSSKFRSFSLDIDSIIGDSKTGAKKYLYLCYDDIIIESVNLKYQYGSALCVSTQAGCRMRCVFCESARNGLLRNLTWDEMLSQALLAQRGSEERIKNIVLMGSGEPLDNYSQTKKFIDKLTSDDYGYSKRRITLSTCGIVPGIEQMAKDKLFVNLAISLHAPFHSMRERLMPVEKAYPLPMLLSAAESFAKASGRRITFEYSVIEGLNDTIACAKELKQITSAVSCLVNLIDINESTGSFRRNSGQAVASFSRKLENLSIPHTVRRNLGSSINAACGQLSGFSQRS